MTRLRVLVRFLPLLPPAPAALSTVVAATGAFCDGTLRTEVERFFGETAGVPNGTLRLALDGIDACRDRRVRLGPQIAEWLTAQRFLP